MTAVLRPEMHRIKNLLKFSAVTDSLQNRFIILYRQNKKTETEMKKTIAILTVLMLAVPMKASTDNDRPISITEMPAIAKNFISTYFPSETVALAKEERDLFRISYEVLFTSGSKVEFGQDGIWTKISCRYSEVPQGIVPDNLSGKVMELYPGSRIIGIEKDRRTVEIKLDNRMELKFSKDGRLLDVDD